MVLGRAPLAWLFTAESTMTERCLDEPILVTGATGFIGRRLMARLLAEGCRPRALVLPDDAVPIEWGDRVEVIRGDITRRADVGRALRDGVTLFHLAAVVSDWGSPELYRAVTVRGTELVLDAAAQRKTRAILVSSVAVYGDALNRKICDERRALGKATGFYGRSKQAQEQVALRLEAQQGLRVTIVRPATVFGPRCHRWVDQLVARLHAQQPVLIGDGRRVAGLTYVDNLVDLLVRAAGTPAAVGRIYNGTDDNEVTWLRYMTDLAQLTGAPQPKSLPRWVAKAAARGYETLHRWRRRSERPPLTCEAVNALAADHRVPIDKARRDLGYEPPMSYDEGMAAVASYLTRGRQAR
jgi:nucleoside-diphosphate-sugar epimerase